MKKYRVRYSEVLNYRVDIIANNQEEAKKTLKNISKDKRYSPELISSSGESLDYMMEVDENGEDIEGTDWC
jgi:hypothetical protein